MRRPTSQDVSPLRGLLWGLACFLLVLTLALGHRRLYELETENQALQASLAELELQRGALEKEARRGAAALAREYGMVPLDPQAVIFLEVGRGQ